MARVRLTDQNGDNLVVQEGESYNLNVTFADVAATPTDLTLSDISTLTATLYAGSTILNSRDAQDIKNTNDGSVTAAGVLTLALAPADNAIVDTDLNDHDLEEHILRLQWTWDDGSDDDRVGIVEYVYEVEKMPDV